MESLISGSHCRRQRPVLADFHKEGRRIQIKLRNDVAALQKGSLDQGKANLMFGRGVIEEQWEGLTKSKAVDKEQKYSATSSEKMKLGSQDKSTVFPAYDITPKGKRKK